MNKEDTVEQARELRGKDELEASLELLLPLLEEYYEDALVLFEVGGAYDILGMAPEAIPYYEKAIENGLEDPELEECYVCLGTSHRVIGEFEDSVDVLEQAVERYPESNGAKAFLAIAFYGNGQYAEAVQILMEALLETTADEDLQSYSDTLNYFKDNLDEVWPD
jgi:tetratricopeptide (TPR) repeat protein